MGEITFIIEEKEGGFTARAQVAEGNRTIVAEADSRAELVESIRDAVRASFDRVAPRIIRLHFVHDEVISLDKAGDIVPIFPIKGPYRFDDPFTPVAVEDWEALR